jgi:hypothetical protein
MTFSPIPISGYRLSLASKATALLAAQLAAERIVRFPAAYLYKRKMMREPFTIFMKK